MCSKGREPTYVNVSLNKSGFFPAPQFSPLLKGGGVGWRRGTRKILIFSNCSDVIVLERGLFLPFCLGILCRGQGNCGSLGDHGDHRAGGNLTAIKDCCVEGMAHFPEPEASQRLSMYYRGMLQRKEHRQNRSPTWESSQFSNIMSRAHLYFRASVYLGVNWMR